jgi:hypothetical protein
VYILAHQPQDSLRNSHPDRSAGRAARPQGGSVARTWWSGCKGDADDDALPVIDPNLLRQRVHDRFDMKKVLFELMSGGPQHERMSNVLELLEELVAIDSVNPSLVPGAAGERGIAAFVAGWATRAGLTT